MWTLDCQGVGLHPNSFCVSADEVSETVILKALMSKNVHHNSSRPQIPRILNWDGIGYGKEAPSSFRNYWSPE